MWEDQGTKIIDTIVKAEGKQVDLRKGVQDLNNDMAKWQEDPIIGLQLAFAELTKALKPLLELIASIVSAFSNWVSENPILAATITAVATAIGILFGLVLALAPIFTALATTAAAAGVTIGALLSPFLAIVGIIIGVIALIGALIAVFVNLYNSNEDFRNKVQEIWTSIQNVFYIVLEYIKNLVQTIMTEVSAFFFEILGRIRTFWDENGQQIMAIVTMYMNIIQSVIQGVMGVIKGIFEVIWPIIVAVIRYAWETIKLIVRTAIDLVLGIIQTMLKVLRGDWEGAWNSIKQTVENIWGNITSFLEGIDLAGTGKQIMQGLIDGISSMGSAIWDSVTSIGQSIKDGFTDFFDINSPSRMMRDEIGKYIGEGLAIGIQRSTNQVANASRAMQEAATPNVTNQSKQQDINVSMPALKINPAPVFVDGYELTKITFDYIDGMIQDRVQHALSIQG